MPDRLQTGITVLDRQLGGGLPAGSVVVLSADPASQSELFLYELTAARNTLYLTTLRTDQAVNDAIASAQCRVGQPQIRDIGGNAPLDSANKLVHELPEEWNLIIDVLDELERQERPRFRSFMNNLQTLMKNTGGLAVLHTLDGDSTPPNRDLSKHMADVVFDLDTQVRGGEIQNRLAVPKFRGGEALEETIKLRLAEEVTIDTSRDIA